MSLEPTAAVRRRSIDRAIYTWAVLAAIIIVFAGFARTYYLKGVFGTPALSGLVHLHGLVMTAWFALFFVQVRLVASNRVDLHRQLGVFGGLLAAMVAGVGTLTGIAGAARGAAPPGVPPLSFLAIPLGEMVVFATLVALALGYRQRAAIHKRLILLSTLSMLTPAIARIPVDFIHNGGLPMFFGLTDLCLLASVGFDTYKNRRLHPAFGWGFLFIFLSQGFRFWLAGTPQWLRFAAWLTS